MTTLGSVRIKGVVRKDGAPVEGAYLTLNQGDDFIAERRTGPDGIYEFHTSAGDWTVICRSAGSEPSPKTISSSGGEVAVDFDL